MKHYSIVVFWEGLRQFETISFFTKTMSDALKLAEESAPSAVIVSCFLSHFDY